MDEISINFINNKSDSNFHPNWNLLTPKNIKLINSGCNVFHSFCSNPQTLDYSMKNRLNCMINLSSYKDNEEYYTGIPKVDLYNMRNNTLIVGKIDYIIPCEQKIQVTPEFVSDTTYLRSCNDSDVIFERTNNLRTFITKKTIVPYTEPSCCQLTSSELSKNDVMLISQHEGHNIDQIILLERTKQDTRKTDNIIKIKSLLCYTYIPDGFYISHINIALISHIPSFLTPIIDQLSHFIGISMSSIVRKTRNYYSHYDNYKSIMKRSNTCR